MRRADRTAAGFMLIETMVLVIMSVALGGLLIVVLNDAMYLQRTSGAHADRRAAIAALARQLRRDVRAAAAGRWDGVALTLERVTADGRQDVRYAIATSAVVRTENGVETHAWQATRLQFAGRVERGPLADVFLLDLIELPPPRARQSSARSAPLSLVIPPPVGGGQP